MPVIKVATPTDLGRRGYDLVDIDAGSIAHRSVTIEDVGWAMSRLL